MSRIGKMPVQVPAKVEVSVEKTSVAVKGPKGELKRKLPAQVGVEIEGGQVIVTRDNESRQARANHGLTRALIANMVKGVSDGFTRTLEINGVGYRAAVQGKYVRFDLGYSHPIFYELPKGVTVEISKTGVGLVLSGIDRDTLGEVAATIRGFRKPEPYKGKGIKYAEETIIRKAGKQGGKK